MSDGIELASGSENKPSNLEILSVSSEGVKARIISVPDKIPVEVDGRTGYLSGERIRRQRVYIPQGDYQRVLLPIGTSPHEGDVMNYNPPGLVEILQKQREEKARKTREVQEDAPVGDIDVSALRALAEYEGRIPNVKEF